jgi:hypothetical protein
MTASNVESVPRGLVRQTYAHGASSEAASVAKVVDLLSRQSAARATLAEKTLSDFRTLLTCIVENTIEDGVSHPGEKVLADFLREHGTSSLLTLATRTDDCRMATLMRLLGRNEGLDSRTHVSLLAHGLNSLSVELRDAAAQAAELWEDPATLRPLRSHLEPTPWLDDYIRLIAESISSRAAR